MFQHWVLVGRSLTWKKGGQVLPLSPLATPLSQAGAGFLHVYISCANSALELITWKLGGKVMFLGCCGVASVPGCVHASCHLYTHMYTQCSAIALASKIRGLKYEEKSWNRLHVWWPWCTLIRQHICSLKQRSHNSSICAAGFVHLVSPRTLLCF